MSIFEYDKEKEEKKLRKAEYESGITAGEAKKAKEIAESLLKAGVSLKKVSEIIQISESDIRGWFGESINKLEVSAMSIFEYDKEKEEKKLRKAEYESGITAGEAKKAKEIAESLLKAGVSLKKVSEIIQISESDIRGWFGESINKLEVSVMSIFEYDKEKEEKKLRKAEYEGGYESGITAGEAKKAKEIILLMYNSGERIDKIAQYTGYSVDDIKNIINSSQVSS